MIAALALAISCATSPVSTRTSAPLNCLDLVGVPALPAASGMIALRYAPSPFGISIDADGRTRYRLVATVTGLPEPRALGDYRAYVAWAYSLSLDSAIKLGPVHNGTIELAEVNLMQFRILVTAERSADVTRRAGRLVLRGTSPSARLVAHQDSRFFGASSATDGMGTVPSAMPGMHTAMQSAALNMPRDSILTRPRGPAVIHAKSGDTITLGAMSFSAMLGERRAMQLGYDSRSPGPTIDVQQGSTVTVRVDNALPMPTSVHWHGIRLANTFDGAAGLTQAAIEPGSAFTYTLRFPDAGVFWYHPHVREDLQLGLGLYGNIRVHSSDPAYFSPADREEMLALSDALVGPHGPIPFGSDAPTHALMGRFGNLFLVNGVPRPTLTAQAGDIVRFFVTNASNARIYNLSIPATRMKLVAGDAGKFEREEWVDNVVIGPSERYSIDVRFPRAGDVALVNRVQAIDHMVGVYWLETDTLAVVRVAQPRVAPARAASTMRFDSLRVNADVAASIAPFRAAFAKPVDRELVVSMRAQNLPASVASMLTGINAALDWNDGMSMVNATTTPREIAWLLRDPRTGRENMDIDWRFRRGDVVKIKIFNDPETAHAMSHPLHLHGQRFLVLARDGVRNSNLVWKDTAIIPAGETVELLVDMSNPGRWMMHCHIAEHVSGGMMASFVVE